MSKRIKGSTGSAKPKKRVIEEPATPSDGHLVWRFGRLDHFGRFACQTLAGADVPALEQELVAFQSEPIWSLRRKHWLKFVPASDMTPDGQTGLSAINPQEDGLWQLHLHRYKWRIWGYFEDPEFFFLWWDSDHAVATGKSRNRRSS